VPFFFNPFLSAAKKVEQNKAKTLASMGLKTHFARVAIKKGYIIQQSEGKGGGDGGTSVHLPLSDFP
jgi:hypothetical protein